MQALHIPLNVKAERSDMAFDGVAVVAEKTPRAGAIMAMVSTWVGFAGSAASSLPFQFERLGAYSALVVLHDEKGIKRLGRHPGAPLPHLGVLLGKLFGIRFNLIPTGLLVSGFCLSLLSAGFYVWAHIVCAPSSDGFLGLVIGFASFNACLAIALVGFSGLSQVFLPLFWGAVRLFHLGYLRETDRLSKSVYRSLKL